MDGSDRHGGLMALGLCVIAFVLLLPLIVITSLPNLFFGFKSSSSESITRMTEQAMAVGGTYMSLEEFEKSEIDAMVTRIAGEYAENGTAIDEIKVESSFTMEDLMWLIAINSVSHEQNLEETTAAEIQALASSRITYSPSLIHGEKTVLRVSISKISPEGWMEALGFSEEAKTWAGALYESLSESDAITKYAPEYAGYRPSYGGDTTYSGGVEHGSSYGNDIDISRFTSPATKNNLDLAEYATQAWGNNWGYVWGTFGQVLTQSLLEYKVEQYPDGVGEYEDYIEEHYLNRRTADCIGLIKGYGWFDPESGKIIYGSNGIPDYNADQMYRNAVKSGAENGSITDMPDLPGLVLWKNGHTGVYIGGGYAIEAMSTKKGVGKTQVAGRGWETWYKLPGITYLE